MSAPAAPAIVVPAAADPAPSPEPEAPPSATLVAGTPVVVMLDQDLSTTTAMLGDRFPVIVLHDVIDRNTVVIPQGATGYGEVTFTTNKGSFGKPGIIGIALRHLQLGDRQVALSGRYREEGRNKNGATAATYFAVGVFAGFIKGKPGLIPRGRELKARTGEAIVFTPGVPAVAPVPIAIGAPAIAEPATAPETPTENSAETIQTGGQI
ncbi:hypothetical protein [Sphingopyxis panaciterrae]